MTAYSAKADETGQWHSSALPGGLSYVFGIRTSQFYQAPEALSGTIGGASFTSTINRYEVLEPSTARVLGRFSNVTGTPPVATTNTFGKGRAIYVAATAQPAILQPLYRSLYREIGIERGPVTPKGVVAREVEGRTLYVNTTSSPATIPVTGSCLGRISGRRWASSIQLEPFGVDLVE
jgi:beta-galactosidase